MRITSASTIASKLLDSLHSPVLQALGNKHKVGAMKLNIPLERKNHLGYWVVAGCLLFTVASAVISPPFATVFFASSVAGLPMLLLYFTQVKSGIIGRFFKLLGLLIYISFAKVVLVPVITNVILRVVT